MDTMQVFVRTGAPTAPPAMCIVLARVFEPDADLLVVYTRRQDSHAAAGQQCYRRRCHGCYRCPPGCAVQVKQKCVFIPSAWHSSQARLPEAGTHH